MATTSRAEFQATLDFECCCFIHSPQHYLNIMPSHLFLIDWFSPVPQGLEILGPWANSGKALAL